MNIRTVLMVSIITLIPAGSIYAMDHANATWTPQTALAALNHLFNKLRGTDTDIESNWNDDDTSYIKSLKVFLQKTGHTISTAINPHASQEEQGITNKVSRFLWKLLPTSTPELAGLGSKEEAQRTQEIYEQFTHNFINGDNNFHIRKQYIERVESALITANTLCVQLRHFNNTIEFMHESSQIQMVYTIIPTIEQIIQLKEVNRNHLPNEINKLLSEETNKTKSLVEKIGRQHNLQVCSSIDLEASQTN